MLTRCLYPECGKPLLDGGKSGSWDGRYCDERCRLLDLIVRTLAQMRDPQPETVAELRLVAEGALRAAYAFAFRVTVAPELNGVSSDAPRIDSLASRPGRHAR